MPGLNLGFSAGAFIPAPALPPSYAGTAEGGTISARAYGIGANVPGGRPVAGLGSAAVGTLAAVALLGLWYTLPR